MSHTEDTKKPSGNLPENTKNTGHAESPDEVRPDDDLPGTGTILHLYDESGRISRYEFLDIISYSGTDYAVMLPADKGGEDNDQVMIFRIEDGDQEENTLVLEEDADKAEAIFNLFKVKNATRFDFA